MPIPTQTAVAKVEAFFDAYGEHRVEDMVDLCADNAAFRYVPFEVYARQRVVHGDGQVRTIGKPIWTTLIDCFPDLSNDVTSVRADSEGNVAVEVNIAGTQAKAFGAVKNQGLRYDLPHLFLFHVDDQGLIDDIVAYWDTADWNQQLGWLEVD
ncbi:hypothetical protein GCM10009535_56840 [Streptomyces thermocarboxydovorans]|uniref:SnoaL-like domain-containing protein n=1 Tax=Streptomyces thermocarboxydovorans TaxID=59298 RepID=A0ABP3T147_9ACTN